MASSPDASLIGHIAARQDGPIVAVDIDRCQVFFAYVRIHGYAMVAECERLPELVLRNNLRAVLELGGAQPVQRCRILSIQPNHAVEFELEVLGETGADIDAGFLVVSFATGTSRFPLGDVLRYSRARDVTTQIPQFKELIRQAAAAGPRPRLLDIGGRARSRIQKSLDYPDCDVTVFDIIPDPGVDVVGDAHELSRHFPPDSFDFAMSLAVFEHLLMPWKVAVEMSKVIRTGGVCLIWAPHTHAIHDVPWDFFRFSDQAWHALFNRRTGWEVIATDMSYMVHVVPAVHPSSPAYAEVTHGYMSCGVMARRIGPAEVDWPVALTEVIDTTYPTFPDEEAAHG